MLSAYLIVAVIAVAAVATGALLSGPRFSHDARARVHVANRDEPTFTV